MRDFVIMTEDAELFLTPSFEKGAGSAKAAAANGVAALTAADDTAAITKARELINLLPVNNMASTPCMEFDAPTAAAGKDLQSAVNGIADAGSVVELYADYAGAAYTALATVEGFTVAFAATNKTQDKLTETDCAKLARFVRTCDAFSIPVVTLVDSVGVDNGSPREPAPVFGKLAKAYATATTAKISVVVGNAYGAAFTLLGSRALGADLALALPETVISVLPPEVAVAFLMNDQITQDKPREAVEAEWMETVASPVAAAESGDIDDIIPAYELRARLSSALYMLAEKADTTPDRKHGVPTL